MNVVVLTGVLSRPPTPRTLPSGDVLVAYDVTCARDEGPAESVPVVWLAAPSRALELSAGDEVVAERVVPARQRRRAAIAIDQARLGLGAAPS